ncbi:MAG: hypothetical protein M3162_04230, partial [Thermoproteota archaeon]|nr:hypothetical protein [Thermoproteota archaeon]
AEPSIAPKMALDAPRLFTMNVGNTPSTISVEKSVKKLTKPNIKTLRIPLGFSSLALSPEGNLVNCGVMDLSICFAMFILKIGLTPGVTFQSLEVWWGEMTGRLINNILVILLKVT